MHSAWHLLIILIVGLSGIFESALGISFLIDSEDLHDHLRSHKTKLGSARLKRFVKLRDPAMSAERNEEFEKLLTENHKRYSKVKRDTLPEATHIQPNLGGTVENAIETEDLTSAENLIEGNDNKMREKGDFGGMSETRKDSLTLTNKGQEKPYITPSIFRALLQGKISDMVSERRKRHSNVLKSGKNSLFSSRQRRSVETKEQIMINRKNWRQYESLAETL